MSTGTGWIGVDLDGTLAYYDGWKGIEHIGDPIPEMAERVKKWLAEGKNVRIFTARVAHPVSGEAARQFIEQWCWKHFNWVLPVTHEKDLSMFQLWDDRCVCVERNTGKILGQNIE